jgi:YVTN family beta-propeller protein
MAASGDGRTLYVALQDARRVAVVDLGAREVVRSIDVPATPTGLALAPDGRRLYVTCAAPESTVAVIDTASCKQVRSFPAGDTAMAPVLSPDGERLYVCNRFDDDVSVVDLASGEEIARVAVRRQPVAAAVTHDGRTVVVGNHLPLDPGDGVFVRAVVTIIDSATLRSTTVRLPDGAINVRDVCISPDGELALVTHVLGSYTLVTSQVNGGWINTSALSVIDLRKKEFDSNALLDDYGKGAANPWGIAYAGGGKTLCVAHSGTHDMSVVDAARMLGAIREFGELLGPMGAENVIAECKRRVKLPGNGPRELAVVGSKVYLTEYFTDTIAVVDLDAKPDDHRPATIRLGPAPQMSLERLGEMLFHDATLCFEHWQSCASCHADGRSDALNWDLLNDGGGSPRNTKSLLFAHRTPPVMATGVRAKAEVAVRAGIEHILFNYDNIEAEAAAIDAYLKSLRPVPSPRLVDGRPSESARRGKQLFESDEVGCASCHPAPLYTDLDMHELIPPNSWSREKLDTPTLIEVWRTAPYMNDGRFTTVRKLLIKGNHGVTRGGIEKLTEQQIDDLVEFVLSL